jgi:hypothetical protein
MTAPGSEANVFASGEYIRAIARCQLEEEDLEEEDLEEQDPQ